MFILIYKIPSLLRGIIVDREFEGVLSEIQETRILRVIYDHALPVHRELTRSPGILTPVQWRSIIGRSKPIKIKIYCRLFWI